jgi:hypothetical protein|nr:hypothetical protein [Actibacterium sp.]|tara:strand:- start:6414 stop:6806 length:393 start_codon:yes stop_codon:yes gene_type:complete
MGLEELSAEAFTHVSARPVENETQIQTRICYSEFDEIVPGDGCESKPDLDLRSNMGLLKVFGNLDYPRMTSAQTFIPSGVDLAKPPPPGPICPTCLPGATCAAPAVMRPPAWRNTTKLESPVEMSIWRKL